MFVAMVALGSGGAFNGMSYVDDAGRICSGQDYILNRLPLAQAYQYEIAYAMMQNLDCVSPFSQPVKERML
jgi:hypothetical protein